MRSVVLRAFLVQLVAAGPCPALSADLNSPADARIEKPHETIGATTPGSITGRASVLDGRTLWFPERGVKLRLAEIDTCELPQWAYDPTKHDERASPKPVPCGPLAKAWLKRTIGEKKVVCRTSSWSADGSLVGVCTSGGRDLAVEMLRVGWARIEVPSPARSAYLAWQRHAMSARYGMWAAYVLDMDEWREKAIDKTLSRRPIADFNLLAERQSEISPPFVDARKRPRRTDR